MAMKLPRIVLVIDDHDDGRESLGLLLQALGFLPFLAKSSAEGLAYLRKGLKPCVILLDLIMAGDGWQFRVEQMSNPEWAKIPVIVGTGLNRRPEHIAPDVEIPPERCLLKPLDTHVLVPLLEQACGA